MSSITLGAMLDLSRPLSSPCRAPLGLRRQVGKDRRSFLHVGRKVGHFLHLTDLNDFVFRAGTSGSPFDRLLLRLHLDHRVATDYLLGLREWPVDDLRFASRESEARPHRRRVQAVESEKNTGILQLLVILHHGFNPFRVRHGTWFSILVPLGNHQHHESHRGISYLVSNSEPFSRDATYTFGLLLLLADSTS